MKLPLRLVNAALAGLLAAFAVAAQTPATDGQVTKVDKAGNRIELRHGEIKHLDMPPMKMLYRVRDPRLLDGVGVGDKVRFTAEKLDGYFTVTSIAKTP